jgi:hypothetical protein
MRAGEQTTWSIDRMLAIVQLSRFLTMNLKESIAKWLYASGILPKDSRDSAAAVKSPATASLPPEFSRFLYASIGESSDEMPFSVLSALARRNLDPWEEAARLAELPKESAIARLTSIISSATTDPSAPLLPADTAARLIALLPRSNGPKIPLFGNPPGEAPRNFAPIMVYLIVGVIILASALLGN